jgi:2-polyprenyl-3-methyl-5-hydroxy-6-metoxy-1,4-benzoquinol methylase
VARDNPLRTEYANLSLAEARREVFRLKIESASASGWSPRIRQGFDYFTPDEWYEAILLRLINTHTDWLDVGCGRELFPSNKILGDILSSRCRLLVGVDPDDNIGSNTALHEKNQCLIEQYDTDKQFDVISLRMVAEHVTDPKTTVAALDRLTRAGGRIVIYTVSKWSPASLMAAATPMAIHHAVKQVLWGSSPEDTFPTAYLMNTRKQLQRLFTSAGLVEESFLYLNDCRSLGRWRLTTVLELSAERVLRALGLPYPEICLLGIYLKGK